jgi:hypothetical protein
MLVSLHWGEPITQVGIFANGSEAGKPDSLIKTETKGLMNEYAGDLLLDLA